MSSKSGFALEDMLAITNVLWNSNVPKKNNSTMKLLRRNLLNTLKISLFTCLASLLVISGCESKEEKIRTQACNLVKDYAEKTMKMRQESNAVSREKDELSKQLLLAYVESKNKADGNNIMTSQLAEVLEASFNVPIYSKLDDKEQAIKTFTKEQEQLCYESIKITK